MFITAEFFDELCPSYKKVIKELDDCIVKLQSDATEDDDTEELQQKVFEKFCANYLMPKEYWVLYESTEDTPHERINIRQKGLNHFFFDRNLEALPYDDIKNHLKIMNFTGDRSDKLMQSIYPHSDLKECYQIYERKLKRPPSKNIIIKYKEMKQLYQNIKAAENNVIEWFENLLKVDDTEFLIHNVEYRLGGNLLDKKLWKLYIKFLENADTNKMLEVYSKYCRFFLDDFEMKKEYKSKVEKYGPIFVEWENLFDFEKKVSNLVEENSDDNISDKQVGPEYRTHTETMFRQSKDESDEIQKALDKNLLKKFYQNYQNQIFPFQKPLIEYILENANAAVWRKLYQTCKYFFAKKNVPVCYRLQIEGVDSVFVKESLMLNFSCNENDYLNNTWITTTLNCNFNQSIPQNYISKILPRLYKCEAKYITIWNQKLSLDDLKFLICSGNVVKCDIICSRITDEKDEWIYLENIMEFLPKIEQLQLSNVKVNKNTAKILEAQNFNSKINELILLDIFGEPFNTMEFSNFVQKNKGKNLFIRMEFKPRRSGFSHDFITNFRKLMEDTNDLKKDHIEINYTPM